MSPPIDLRSDTVTLPTAAMRAAMQAAALGDDGREGDPTTLELQRVAAERLGKEAALFVPSGTMGNLIAALIHCRPGEEVLVERRAHVVTAENNGLTALAGALPMMLDGERGHLSASTIAAALDGDFPSPLRPRLLWLENTANLAGGTVQTVAETRAVCDLAHRRGLAVHLDGARVFHAATALGVPVAELVAPVDSVMFCLSKGLSCPVGSLLVGSGEFVAQAKEVRRQVGGSLRQSGVISAAGLVALEQQVDRLAEDHANARWLAEQLASLPGFEVDPGSVETNILWFRCTDPALPQRSAAAGVQFIALPGGVCRAVTHAGLSRAEIEQAAARLAAVAAR